MSLKVLFRVIAFLTLILLSCWGKQDNNVVRPEAPQYIFTGTVTDSFSGNLLSEIKVVVSANNMLYDVEFTPLETLTDENGTFTVDPIYPGLYTVTLYRYDLAISSVALQIEHGDTTRNYSLPTKFSVKRFKDLASEYIDLPLAINDSLAIIWDNPLKILKSNTINWELQETPGNPLGDTYISTITANDSILFACHFPDTVVVVDIESNSILDRNYIDGVNLVGLTLDEKNNTLWGCSRTMIIEFEQNPLQAGEIHVTEAEGFQAMAFYNQLYVFDNAQKICIRFDNELNITGYFAFVDKNNTRIPQIRDMAFDKNGQLWVVPAE